MPALETGDIVLSVSNFPAFGNTSLLHFHPDGSLVQTVLLDLSGSVSDLAIDAQGMLYAANSERISVYDRNLALDHEIALPGINLDYVGVSPTGRVFMTGFIEPEGTRRLAEVQDDGSYTTIDLGYESEIPNGNVLGAAGFAFLPNSCTALVAVESYSPLDAYDQILTVDMCGHSVSGVFADPPSLGASEGYQDVVPTPDGGALAAFGGHTLKLDANGVMEWFNQSPLPSTIEPFVGVDPDGIHGWGATAFGTFIRVFRFLIAADDSIDFYFDTTVSRFTRGLIVVPVAVSTQQRVLLVQVIG